MCMIVYCIVCVYVLGSVVWYVCLLYVYVVVGVGGILVKSLCVVAWESVRVFVCVGGMWTLLAACVCGPL